MTTNPWLAAIWTRLLAWRQHAPNQEPLPAVDKQAATPVQSPYTTHEQCWLDDERIAYHRFGQRYFGPYRW